MLLKVLRSLLSRRAAQPTPPGPREQLEAAWADIEGLSDRDAIERLAAMSRRGETGPGQQYVLGMLYLRSGQPDLARERFATQRRESGPFVPQCHMGEALARAELARARGEHVVPRPLDAAARSALVSVVICSIRPERYTAVTGNFARLLADVPHEFIGIHDARSLCEGYNRGLRRARGEIVVFSHDDIEIVSPDFAAKLHAYLGDADLLGVAGTSRLVSPTWWQAGWPDVHGQVAQTSDKGRWTVTVFGIEDRLVRGIRALDGLLFAARRDVAAQIGFDEARFDGWHFYDIDFSFSAACRGHRLAIANDILVHHASAGRFDADWKRYAARLSDKHAARFDVQQSANSNVARGAIHTFSNPRDWIEVAEQMIAIARESREATAPGLQRSG